MKIGEFSQINNITKDTARHYIDMGLLVPDKQGAQYEFDESCQKSLDEILALKNMGFSLNQIKDILLFKTFGNLTAHQEDQYYEMLFSNQLAIVKKQLEDLTAVSQNLEQRLAELKKKPCTKAHNIGIPLDTLDLFACPICKQKLTVADASIKDNQIIDGVLKCSLSHEYHIEDGILMGPGYIDADSRFKQENTYIADYIKFTDTSYLESIYKNIEWMKKRLDFQNLEGKVILELGTGVGFSLRNIYDLLPDDCVYLAVDYDINRHKFLKSMLETSTLKKKIIFLCCDFVSMPIGEKLVDIVFDFSGSSNFGFEHEEFLLSKIDHHVKQNAYLNGSYILFKNFSANSMIEDKYKPNFLLDNIRFSIDELGFKTIEDKFSDYLEHGGKYEDYFVKGEKVYSYLYYGKR